VANAAGLHPDQDLSSSWRRNLALDNLEIRARFRNLRRFHRFDCGLDKCCHIVSSRNLVLISSSLSDEFSIKVDGDENTSRRQA
jgi:hypothetical protein